MQKITRGILLSKRQPQRLRGIDSYTVLMLNCDGDDAATTFTDASASGHTITAAGNAQVDTAQKKFGSGSALFDGTGDYLSGGDSGDWAFGANPFTIDLWIRFSNVAVATQYIIGQFIDVDSYWSIYYTTTDRLYFYCINATEILVNQYGSWNPAINTWYHIAVIRGWGGGANSWAICVDGTAIATFTSSATMPDLAAGSLLIGSSNLVTPYPFFGWLEEIRISKGVARWTKNFMPNWGPYY